MAFPMNSDGLEVSIGGCSLRRTSAGEPDMFDIRTSAVSVFIRPTFCPKGLGNNGTSSEDGFGISAP